MSQPLCEKKKRKRKNRCSAVFVVTKSQLSKQAGNMVICSWRVYESFNLLYLLFIFIYDSIWYVICCLLGWVSCWIPKFAVQLLFVFKVGKIINVFVKFIFHVCWYGLSFMLVYILLLWNPITFPFSFLPYLPLSLTLYNIFYKFLRNKVYSLMSCLPLTLVLGCTHHVVLKIIKNHTFFCFKYN